MTVISDATFGQRNRPIPTLNPDGDLGFVNVFVFISLVSVKVENLKLKSQGKHILMNNCFMHYLKVTRNHFFPCNNVLYFNKQAYEL